MATRVEVALPPEHAGLADEVFEVFSRVERVANEWQAGSPLAEINAGAGGPPVACPPELMGILERSLALGQLTHGAFDITWGALWGLWDFTASVPVVPAAEEVAGRLTRIGRERVRLDPSTGTVSLEQGTVLGVGGIAKGHALDQAAALLRAHGVGEFSLSAGGQVVVAGDRNGRPWRVGIRDPRGSPLDYFAMVDVTDASVSTSGDYERFFELDGVRYHHVLDPRTGMPARGVRSATVITSDATLADALSTALMVLGVARGLLLVESLPNVEAVLVDDQGRVHASPGASFLVVHPPKEK